MRKRLPWLGLLLALACGDPGTPDAGGDGGTTTDPDGTESGESETSDSETDTGDPESETGDDESGETGEEFPGCEVDWTICPLEEAATSNVTGTTPEGEFAGIYALYGPSTCWMCTDNTLLRFVLVEDLDVLSQIGPGVLFPSDGFELTLGSQEPTLGPHEVDVRWFSNGDAVMTVQGMLEVDAFPTLEELALATDGDVPRFQGMLEVDAQGIVLSGLVDAPLCGAAREQIPCD
jgi:hypothetical protein